MKPILQVVPFERIQPFKSRVVKERVTLDNPKGAVWFAAVDVNNENAIIGFVCAVVKGKTVRFKSDYIAPEYRGKGIYRSLFEKRLRGASCKAQRATAFCTPLSLPTYLKFGFQVKSWKGDIAFVERML
jgi:GNAT superfamily N-acetyltransferase